MRKKISFRFCVELAAGVASLVMSAITSLLPQWIEITFGLRPDDSNGETEWALTAGLCVVAAIMFIAARLEWRRMAAAR